MQCTFSSSKLALGMPRLGERPTMSPREPTGRAKQVSLSRQTTGERATPARARGERPALPRSRRRRWRHAARGGGHRHRRRSESARGLGACRPRGLVRVPQPLARNLAPEADSPDVATELIDRRVLDRGWRNVAASASVATLSAGCVAAAFRARARSASSGGFSQFVPQPAKPRAVERLVPPSRLCAR